MKRMGSVLCLLALAPLLMPATVWAGSCGVQRLVVTPHVQAVAVGHHHVNAYVPTVAITAVAVPLYSVSYDPASDLRREVEQLRAELRAVGQAMRQSPAIPAQAQAERQSLRTEVEESPRVSAVSVLAARCASCHDADQASRRGGGLTLFAADGSILALGQHRAKVRAAIEGDTMPPRRPLSGAERASVLARVQ